MPPTDSSFADADDLFGDAAGAFLPPDRLTVNEWARRNRWVSGARAGLWNPEVAPYLEEPMSCLTLSGISDVVIPGPGQCGKTAIAENWLGYSIECDPADFGWYLNTDDVLNAYVKDKINVGLLERHPHLQARLGRGDTDNSLRFKRFRGMSVQFLPATASSLINKTFQRIIGDEYDAYDPTFGDPKEQFDVRRQTYKSAGKSLYISHCDRAVGLSPAGWNAGIMKLYARSSRCTWWWRCPNCERTSSPNPGTARHMPIDYPADGPLDTIAAEARLQCPLCDARIEDSQRRSMNRTGQWIGRGQEISEDGEVTGTRDANPIAGFWIVGAMSPFLLTGIGGLARARAAAERGIESGEDNAEPTLRGVLAKQWGYPFVRPKGIDALDATTLAERATDSLVLGTVPEGVRYLVTAIDVQANRFELLTRGFGVDLESWVIARDTVPAEPATDQAAWDRVLRAALDRTFPLADGTGRVMKVRAVGFDSAGEPGVTENAYKAWRRARLLRQARMFGKVSFRETWNLLPLKGGSLLNAKNLIIARPESARNDRNAGARGEIPLGIFNPNFYKDALAGQLAKADAGPTHVHFPAGLRASEAPHPFFEELCAEVRSPAGLWSKTSARNEAWDLMVMTHVMAHLHASRIDWRMPPIWAATWDRNTYVALTEAPAAPGTASAAQPAPQPAMVPAIPAGVLAAAATPPSRRSHAARMA